MPIGEACARAEALKSSLMGRLIPLSRFCLLQPERDAPFRRTDAFEL